jgi:hypothetical protein
MVKAVLIRDMVGGIKWANERLASDLRVMFKRDDTAPPEDLGEIEALLVPESGRFVPATDGEFDHYPLPIDRMLEDARRLKAAGQCRVDLWWKRHGAKRWMEPNDPAWPSLLHEHFRRAQLIYAEIADVSLGQFRPFLGFYNAMPVRFHVRISPGRIGPVTRVIWHPVPSWDMAGADAEYTTDATWPGLDLRTHLEKVQQELGRLGRLASFGGVWESRTHAPSFDGRTWRGAFDGGTPAVLKVCEWIERDLDRVLPRRGC